MTPRRTYHRQPRPNRRFRRLLPAAVLTATIAAASSGGPAAARADAQRAGHAPPHPVHVLAPATKAAAARQATVQPNSAPRQRVPR
jgi:hypothetical protein